MGLDMYLYKKMYIGANHYHRGIKGSVNITQKNSDGELVEFPIRFNRLSEVKEQVGYWRKANAIHAWFVEKVQNGKDDCEDYIVSEEKLRELLETVKFTLNERDNDVASTVLPPKSGFFFGSTDIDEWYWKDLEYTRDTIESLLKEIEEDEKIGCYSDIEYRSSW